MTIAAAAVASRDSLDRVRHFVEESVGRPLSDAEQVVDVIKLSNALDTAKDMLHDAVEAEKMRAARANIRSGTPVHLSVTQAMIMPLEQLYELGKEEAFAELERHGYTPEPGSDELRQLQDAEPGPDPLVWVTAELRSRLNGLTVRIDQALVDAELSGLAGDAIANAILKLPGGRDIASQMVSRSLTSGLAQTFEENRDLVPCWEYSAVLDGGTCDVCRPQDGRRFFSLEELFRVLPDFGPNPNCLGGNRCRCRAVPCPPDDTTPLLVPDAPDDIDDVFQPSPRTDTVNVAIRDSLASIDSVHGSDRNVLAAIPVMRDRQGLLDQLARAQGSGDAPQGAYILHPATGEPLIILVHPQAVIPRLTTAHEVGHAIQHQALGAPLRMDAATAPELAGWRAAIDNSAAVRELRAWLANPRGFGFRDAQGQIHNPNPDRVSYLLDYDELWARSYAQWITEQSGDPGLAADLSLRLLDPYKSQWEAADFKEISDAFDDVFEGLGWLR